MWTPALIFFFIPGVQFKLFFSCSVIVTHLWVAICLMWSKRGLWRACTEPLTISTIFCRAGARVEAGGACLDWVLLGWGHIGCWTVLRKQIRWYKSVFRCIFFEDGDKTTSVCTPLPVQVWSRQVPVVSWGRATVALGSSSFETRPDKHAWAPQAGGRYWEGRPVAHCSVAGWLCCCNRTGREAGEQAEGWEHNKMVENGARESTNTQEGGRDRDNRSP